MPGEVPRHGPGLRGTGIRSVMRRVQTMSFGKILLPTDGSVFTNPAVDKAMELAKVS